MTGAGILLLFIATVLMAVTGQDIPQAMNDYWPLILAFSLMVSVYDIGFTIREAIRAATKKGTADE